MATANAWFMLQPIQPASGVVMAQDLLPPPSAPTSTFVVIENSDFEGLVSVDLPTADDARMTRHYRVSDRFGSSWVIACDDGHEEFLARNEQGDTVLMVVIDQADAAITQFDPPLIVSVPALVPGKVYRDEVAMRVLDLNNPTREKEKGTATRKVEYVGDQLVRTPAGTVRAQRVEITFTADLNLADVTVTTIALVIPGQGIIAEARSQKIRMLGLLGNTSRRVTVLDWDQHLGPIEPVRSLDGTPQPDVEAGSQAEPPH
jgi:hypothetical protein